MSSPIFPRAAARMAPCALLALAAQSAHGGPRTLPMRQDLARSSEATPLAAKPAWIQDAAAAVSTTGEAEVEAIPFQSPIAPQDLRRPSDDAGSPPAAIRSAGGRLPGLMFDEDAQGVVWTRGRGYKAGFDGQSATIVPFFGSDAPQNYPIVFRTMGAALDGEALATSMPARAMRNDRVVGIDRAAFVEEYVLEEERLEQRFVFLSLPRDGELVVRIAVEAELAVTEVGGALRFSNELGHVDYGQAFAIDAAGARIPIERTFEDGTIALTVPRTFVAGATFPLTVDPFVTFFTVSGTPREELYPDVSYDAGSDRWCVVWTEIWSAADYDAYVELMTSTGASTSVLTVDFTADYWTTPRIANNAVGAAFLVVASVDPAPTASNVGRIRGRMVTPGGAIGVPFDVSPVGPTDRYLPDVGGDPNPGSPSYFCVVWQRTIDANNFDIEMRLVNSNGVPQSTFQRVNTTSGRHTLPAISNSNGIHDVAAPERWTVAWQFEFDSNDHDIYARQILENGVFLTAMFPVNTLSTDETEPAVSTVLDPIGGHRYCLIAYQHKDGSDEDILGTLVGNPGTPMSERNLTEDGPLLEISYRQLTPEVDSDGRHFLVGHVEVVPSTDNWNIWMSDYYVSGGSLVPCAVHENFVGAPTSEAQFSLHSKASSGGPIERYFGTWIFQSASNGWDVQGGLWDGCTGGAVTTFCAGDGSGVACPCGNSGDNGNGCASSVNPAGARLLGTGDARVSLDSFVLQASGMPATATCLYFQGTAQVALGAGSVFGDGKRCASGTVIRLGTQTNSGGASQYPSVGDPSVSVRGAVPALGATRYYQAWYRNAGDFCTTSTFNLTNGLRVVWAP